MEAKSNIPLLFDPHLRQSIIDESCDNDKFEIDESTSTYSSVSSLKFKLSQLRSCLSNQFIRESRDLEEDMEIVKTLEISRQSLSHLSQLVHTLTIRSHNSGQKEASHHQFYSEIKNDEERVLNIEHDDADWMEQAVQEKEGSKRPFVYENTGRSFLSHLKQSVKNIGEKYKTQKLNPIPRPPERKGKPPKQGAQTKLKLERASQTNLSITQGNISRGFSRDNTANQSQRLGGGALALSMLEQRHTGDYSTQIVDQTNAQTPKGRVPKTVRQKLQEMVQHRATAEGKLAPGSKQPMMTERQMHGSQFAVKGEWSYSNQLLGTAEQGIPHPESSQPSQMLRKIVNILPKSTIPRPNAVWKSHLEANSFRTADPLVHEPTNERRALHETGQIGYQDVRRTSSPESIGNNHIGFPQKRGLQLLVQEQVAPNQSVNSHIGQPDRQRVPRNSTRVLYPNMMAVQNSPEYQSHTSNNASIEYRSHSREFDGLYLKPSGDSSSKRLKLVESFLLPARTPEAQEKSSADPTKSLFSRSALFETGYTGPQHRVDAGQLDIFSRPEQKPVSMASAKTLSNRTSAINSDQQTPNTHSPVLGKSTRR